MLRPLDGARERHVFENLPPYVAMSANGEVGFPLDQQELPVRCRTIFNLYAIEGFQQKEIADMLGITEGTVKSQFARARTILQDKILKSNKYKYEIYAGAR